MSTVSFVGVSALNYGITPLIGAIQDNKRLWPPTTATYTFDDIPTGNPATDIYAFAGDKLTFEVTAAGGPAWTSQIALTIFRVEGGKWTANYHQPTTGGFLSQEADLDGTKLYPALKNDTTYPFTLDTLGMEPGEYVIVTGRIDTSGRAWRHYFHMNQGVQYRLHLRPQFPKGRPGRFDIDLRLLNWRKRYTQFETVQWWEDVDPCPHVKVPAGTQQIYIIPDGQSLDTLCMWLYTTNQNAFFGVNADLSQPGTGNSMQTRNGGPWNIPDTAPGDVIHVGTGWDPAAWQLDAVILDMV